jgi:hypothetical protein
VSERRDIATRFKPGNSGGPGRPKGSKSLSTRLKEYLEGAKIGDEKLRRKQVADEVVEHLVKRATGRKSNASLQAIDMLFDRTEGKVATPIDLPQQDLESVRNELKERREALSRNREPGAIEGPAE